MTAPSVVLLAAPGTLPGIDRSLRRAGVRLVRIESVVPRPVDPRTWRPRLARAPAPDTVVVTSRAAVGAGVRPARRVLIPPTGSPEFWAAGPGTAAALRRDGVDRVRRPRAVGAAAVARSLARGPRRRVVYLRSDAAGPELARLLRRRGHRVLDLVVYRLEAPSRLTGPARHALAAADLVVVTSPSGLASLRRRVGRPTFVRLARTARLVVLGDRSRRAARIHGFRHIAVAPSTVGQRFTRYLLRELRDARA
ncbi:MAG TPA: uroporphyrinogen-III synthase [Thermoplasmata archaeon]|nr:uroporphyrinogen-III synthase [Thermoplasmata archaeon]